MTNVRILLAASVIAIIAAPVVAMAGAFTPDFLLFGLALVIMGGLGLFAGMKALSRSQDNEQA